MVNVPFRDAQVHTESAQMLVTNVYACQVVLLYEVMRMCIYNYCMYVFITHTSDITPHNWAFEAHM